MPDNPASELKAPKITLCPTMPFTREEMVKILGAIAEYRDDMDEPVRKMRGGSGVWFCCFATVA
jgi:hypothetical protein